MGYMAAKTVNVAELAEKLVGINSEIPASGDYFLPLDMRSFSLIICEGSKINSI